MKLTRLLRPLLAPALSLMLATVAQAECVGRDLFDSLPQDRQAALEKAAHSVPYAQGLMFRATKGEQRVTLIGTYHLPDPRHAALVARARSALAEAQVLLVEAGPKQEARLKQAMATDPELIFTTGKTLPEMLSEADWQRTRVALAAHGMPSFLAAKMRPAFVAMTLSLPPCAVGELQKGAKGLDKLMMEAAESRGLPIAALEPWDTVFTLFNAIRPEEGLEMLRAAVIGAPLVDDMGVTMADLYFRAEPRLIWEFARMQAIEGGMPAAEVDQQMQMSEALMMSGRNRAWLPRIETAAAKGPVVVAVGALHLSGQAGLLELLRADGWQIERLDP